VTMTEHQIELEDLLKGFKTSQERGLTPEQAAANLQEFGTNELTPPPKTPEWVKFMDEMTGEFNLLLWAAGVACFVSYGMLPQGRHRPHQQDGLVREALPEGLLRVRRRERRTS